jgi:hypothetical protein
MKEKAQLPMPEKLRPGPRILEIYTYYARKGKGGKVRKVRAGGSFK